MQTPVSLTELYEILPARFSIVARHDTHQDRAKRESRGQQVDSTIRRIGEENNGRRAVRQTDNGILVEALKISLECLSAADIFGVSWLVGISQIPRLPIHRPSPFVCSVRVLVLCLLRRACDDTFNESSIMTLNCALWSRRLASLEAVAHSGNLHSIGTRPRIT